MSLLIIKGVRPSGDMVYSISDPTALSTFRSQPSLQPGVLNIIISIAHEPQAEVGLVNFSTDQDPYAVKLGTVTNVCFSLDVLSLSLIKSRQRVYPI